MIRIQRRLSITLLEVLIAIALVSILTSVCLGYYRQIHLLNHELENLRKESFLEKTLQYRLSKIIPAITLSKDDPYFYLSVDSNQYMESNSLVFVYDRGVDIQPQFSNEVLARLYLNSKKQVCISYWPRPSKWKYDEPPMITEILKDGVEALSFSFYEPKQWLNEWDQEKEKLPAMLKITFKGESEETYSYPLAQSKFQINYPYEKRGEET
jgi:type II secretory pathway component PulJ